MSRLQEREDLGRVGGAPEPPEANRGGEEGGEPPYPPQMPGAWPAITLVAMVAVLLAGYWEPYPFPSLIVPAIAIFAWRHIIFSVRVERWLVFYVAAIYLYTVLRAVADDAGLPIQVDYAIAVDRLLFRGALPSVELQAGFFTPSSVNWLDTFATGVHASFFIVPHAAAVFIWLRYPRALPAYVTAVLLTLYIGLILFFLLPTVPPWLAARQGEIRGAYRIIDFVTRGVDLEAYRSLYRTLAEPNSVAAMPSIHMAVTCVVLLRARDFAPRLVWPLALYTVVMGFSLVYLGEHYVVDVIVGAVVAVVANALLGSRWVPVAMPAPVRAGRR